MDQLHWNNKDKTNNEKSQVTISRKSTGNFLCWPNHGHKFTSLSWHPLCLMHKEMCVRQRKKNIMKLKTYSDSSAFFFCMNSSLANWMTAEKCGDAIPTTQRSPHLSMPETDLYNRGKNKQTNNLKKKKKNTGGPKCGLYLQSKLCFWSNSVGMQELWKPEQSSFTHLGKLLAGFGKRYLSNSTFEDTQMWQEYTDML